MSDSDQTSDGAASDGPQQALLAAAVDQAPPPYSFTPPPTHPPHQPPPRFHSDTPRDLESCSRRLPLLATAIEGDRTVPLPFVTLYQWQQPAVAATEVEAVEGTASKGTAATARLQKVAEVALSPDVLAFIDGFADLDTFCLPDDLDIASALSALAESSDNAVRDGVPDAQALVKRLPITEEGAHFVRFFAFPVYSSSSSTGTDADVDADADADTASGTLADEPHLVWQWIKPRFGENDEHRYYQQQGWWGAELQSVLEDGYWNGGGNLRLLVRAVSEKVYQRLKIEIAKGHRLFTLSDLVD